jgi:hypothetical protein
MLPFGMQAELLAAGNPGRDPDGEPALAHALARARARRTGLRDDAARASAVSAGLGHGEETLLVADLPATLAARAGGRGAAPGGSAAAALFAALVAGDLNGGLGAPRRFVERDFQVVAQAGAPLRAAATTAAAEQVAEPEDVAEPPQDVAEIGEDGQSNRAGAEPRCRSDHAPRVFGSRETACARPPP